MKAAADFHQKMTYGVIDIHETGNFMSKWNDTDLQMVFMGPNSTRLVQVDSSVWLPVKETTDWMMDHADSG